MEIVKVKLYLGELKCSVKVLRFTHSHSKSLFQMGTTKFKQNFQIEKSEEVSLMKKNKKQNFESPVGILDFIILDLLHLKCIFLRDVGNKTKMPR